MIKADIPSNKSLNKKKGYMMNTKAFISKNSKEKETKYQRKSKENKSKSNSKSKKSKGNGKTIKNATLIGFPDYGKAVGVITGIGVEIKAKAVVLTNGTFLNGLIHIGEKQFGGGRIGEKAATGITEQLIDLGFESGRMKTGTPPRIDGRSLNYDRMEIQHGDEDIVGFSFKETEKPKIQKPCYITHTSTEVHNILKTGFEKSPLLSFIILLK